MSLNIELKRCSNLTVRGLDDVFVFSLVLSDINRQLLEQTTLDASHIRVMSCCVVVWILCLQWRVKRKQPVFNRHSVFCWEFAVYWDNTAVCRLQQRWSVESVFDSVHHSLHKFTSLTLCIGALMLLWFAVKKFLLFFETGLTYEETVHIGQYT